MLTDYDNSVSLTKKRAPDVRFFVLNCFFLGRFLPPRFRPVRFDVRRKFGGVFPCLSPGNVVKYSVSHKNARGARRREYEADFQVFFLLSAA